MHPGADYHGHELLRVVSIPEEQQYELIYRFHWWDDGITDVGFICDQGGGIQHLEIKYTNASLVTRPFIIANLTLKSAARWLVDKYKDNFNPWIKKGIDSAINNGDAKKLLVYVLQAAQSLGQAR